MGNWLTIRRSNITDVEELAHFLHLDPSLLLKNGPFPLNIPLRLAKKIEKNTLDDPILRQFVPLIDEENDHPAFLTDPVGEAHCKTTSRLLTKYNTRALLITSPACAMHCRYCFRRHFPYAKQKTTFDEEIAHIASDTTLSEVILSGGDPLSLTDAQLDPLLAALDAIPHLKRLRFHTRFPVGIPERLDASFFSLLKGLRLQVIFVLHINHPREIDSDLLDALDPLQRLGIPLLNQAVLLHGVNDDFATLRTLFTSLADNAILPYYLHLLDPVAGAAHFDVPEARARALMQELQAHLPGYALPRLVREVPGKPSKTVLF